MRIILEQGHLIMLDLMTFFFFLILEAPDLL